MFGGHIVVSRIFDCCRRFVSKANKKNARGLSVEEESTHAHFSGKKKHAEKNSGQQRLSAQVIIPKNLSIFERLHNVRSRHRASLFFFQKKISAKVFFTQQVVRVGDEGLQKICPFS